MSDSLQSHGLYSLLNSPGQNTGVGRVAFPFSRGSSQPRSPVLQVDSLPAEPQGKPKNTEVGSLSLLQEIFLTQESNRGLLHCRRINFQLSYQLDVNVILHLIVAQTEAQRFSSMLKGHKTSKWRRRM